MLPIHWSANEAPIRRPTGRQLHEELLDEEVRLQLEAFRQQAETPARQLLEINHELYVAAYLRHDAAGHAVLAFSAARGLPRLREHFQVLLLPQELVSHRAWPVGLTYRELLNRSLDRAEVACVWHGTDPSAQGYAVAGFRGLPIELCTRLVAGCILALGPQLPPIDYLRNLIQLIRHTSPTSAAGQLLDLPTEPGSGESGEWQPQPLSTTSTAAFLLGQSRLNPSNPILVQGPPGTGKTYLLAELCDLLLQQGQRVLVTALTNRTLLELAAKPQLAPWRKQGRVLKSALSTDEQAAAPGLQSATRLTSPAGTLVLATFHMASFAVVPNSCGQDSTADLFDYVLVDEASQALLATLAMARSLGSHHIWVGDPAQLPPVVRQSPERVHLPGAILGLQTVSHHANLPSFRLTNTHRLPPRAAAFTALFYQGSLSSATAPPPRLPNLSALLNASLHLEGGPVWIPVSMAPGQESPPAALQLTQQLVADLFHTGQPLSIAVLTHRRATSRALQQVLSPLAIPKGSTLIVDTVARVQGLTCDVCLFVLPNLGYAHSLQAATFNVATSRARLHTILLADPALLQLASPASEVASFLRRVST